MNRITAEPPEREAALLVALLAAGGYWGLAPDWVPRAGYTRDPGTLVAALAGLRRLLQNESIRLRRGRGRAR
ncbi:hypothetical protein ABZ714_17905 [Streptomyces sp. NPDC006798]|uniref:hypothetical protein n=1 Tax=Streptomyces sp. NPDC006798 TaxID=3155462 RepID=UPI0033FECD53